MTGIRAMTDLAMTDLAMLGRTDLAMLGRTDLAMLHRPGHAVSTGPCCIDRAMEYWAMEYWAMPGSTGPCLVVPGHAW